MKKWFIFYVILIILLSISMKITDKRTFTPSSTSVNNYRTTIKQKNPNLSNEQIEKRVEKYKSRTQFWKILKRAFIISTVLIIIAFLLASLRNSFINEFFHLKY